MGVLGTAGRRGRGIGLAIDEGEFDQALALCEQALALGLGKVYAAKKASVERMM